MQVVSTSQLRVGALRWTDGTRAFVSVFAKATYQLQPGVSPLAPSPLPLSTADILEGRDPSSAARAPCDLVPARIFAEVTLVGSARTPGHQPATHVTARLQTGSIDKSVMVFCDRVVDAEGRVMAGAPFMSMPLVYERAAGGPSTWNPVGIGPHSAVSPRGVRLPNLVPHGFRGGSAEPIPPTGYGPISAAWPGRAGRLGRLANLLEPRDGMLVPADFDRRYFQAAPEDQQQHEPFVADQRIILENIVAGHERFMTDLGGWKPRAVFTGQERTEVVPMRADALWIDADNNVAALTFRGLLQLRSFDEAGRIVVALEGGEARDITATDPAVPGGTALPFRGDESLPASELAAVAPSRPPVPAPLQPATHQPAPAQSPPVQPAPPAAVHAAASAPLPAIPATNAQPLPSYLNTTGSSQPAPPRHRPIVAGSEEASNAALMSGAAPEVERERERKPLRERPKKGVEETHAPLELLWFDATALDRLRAASAKGGRRELSKRGELSSDDASDVLRAIRSLELASPDRFGDELDRRSRADTAWGVPLAIEATLSFVFDARAELDATIAVYTQLPGADPAAADAARTVATNEWPAPASIEAATQRLRSIAGRPARGPALEPTVRRMLRERKKLRTIDVQGEPRIVLRLHWPNVKNSVPLYARHDLAAHIPLFDAVPVRAVVDVIARQDADEAVAEALIPRALARCLGASASVGG